MSTSSRSRSGVEVNGGRRRVVVSSSLRSRLGGELVLMGTLKRKRRGEPLGGVGN